MERPQEKRISVAIIGWILKTATSVPLNIINAIAVRMQTRMARTMELAVIVSQDLRILTKKLPAMALERLKAYPGFWCVESFDPRLMRWFKKHASEVPRGQLVCPLRAYGKAIGAVGGFFLSNLLLNAFGRPDFIAYDVNATRFVAPHVQRALFKTPMAAWTVKTMPVAALVETRGEMGIFERIRP